MSMVPVFVADFGVVSELNVHVGLSFCDIEGAIQNLNEEAPTFDFDRHRAACERSWDEQLGRIQIDGGTQTSAPHSTRHSTTQPLSPTWRAMSTVAIGALT